MITTPVRDDIRAFAAAVRSHLDDLPADDADDLLDGLEADLADQATEAGEEFRLPDATGYAAELRAAAGLPVRADHRAAPPLGARIARRWHRTLALVRQNPLGAWLLELAVSLRPVWWVLRGIVIFLLIPAYTLPSSRSTGVDLLDRAFAAASPLGLVVLLALLFVSVQWGRGRWAPYRWLRVLRRVVNVAAAVVGPFLLIGLLSAVHSTIESRPYADYVSPTPGLAVDGQRVRNIFAFDANGEPLPIVQLFDQNGDALTTVGRNGGSERVDTYFAGGGGPVPVPVTVPGRPDAWNVFPLREIPAGTNPWGPNGSAAETATAPAFPFLRVQPVPTPALTPTP